FWPILGPIVDLEGIDGDSVRVEVPDFQGRIRASGSGSFARGSLRLTLALDEKPFVLAVEDRDGKPLAAVRVTVTDARQPETMVIGATDAAGSCALLGVPEDAVLVDLRHACGSQFGMPVDATVRKTELVLDPRADLRIAFVDGSEPVAGVTCYLI